MVVERPSLRTRHREDKGLIVQLLRMHLQFGKIEIRGIKASVRLSESASV
ncbi:hypothetical protein ACKFKG_20720 [Phormidesmis sp. 146-35]